MVPAGVHAVTYRKRFHARRGEAAYFPVDLTGAPQQSGPGQHREG